MLSWVQSDEKLEDVGRRCPYAAEFKTSGAFLGYDTQIIFPQKAPASSRKRRTRFADRPKLGYSYMKKNFKVLLGQVYGQVYPRIAERVSAL